MNDADAIDEQFRVRLRGEVFGMAIALAFCAFGSWYFSGISGGNEVINSLFIWSLRIGALGFAGCALMAIAGLRMALLADAIVCALLLVALGITAIVWLLEGEIVLAFMVGIPGLLSGGAAARSWGEFSAWGQATGRAMPTSPVIQGADVEPSVPGRAGPAQTEQSLRPPPAPAKPAIREPDQPPPEGGFLADLGREDD